MEYIQDFFMRKGFGFCTIRSTNVPGIYNGPCGAELTKLGLTNNHQGYGTAMSDLKLNRRIKIFYLIKVNHFVIIYLFTLNKFVKVSNY